MKVDTIKKSAKKAAKIRECVICSKTFSLPRHGGGQAITCSIKCREIKNKARIKNWVLLDKYGIGIEKLTEMLIEQNYCCAICGTHNDKSHNGLHVDHNHTTGEIRKLICRDCNVAIGFMKENPILFLKAAEYLKLHNNTTSMNIVSIKEG
jgi:predicted nucleic acid-binding Zn ribbon protein